MDEDYQQLLPPEEPAIDRTKSVSSQTMFDLVGPHTLACFHSTSDGNNLSTQIEHEPKKEDPVVIRGLYKLPSFHGYESVKDDEAKLKRLTALSPIAFETLALSLADYKPRTYGVEDMLLMVLMKFKHSIPFSSLAVLFDMHPNTVAHNFYAIVDILYDRTKIFVPWPSVDVIQDHMPDSFKEHFPTCRAIIDCTEIKTEKPERTSKQNILYSYYKSGHTVKFLIGNLFMKVKCTFINPNNCFLAITPDGSISFVSRAFGGRLSDKYITNNSGFLQLIRPEDLILADKGFPTIKGMDNIVRPPRAKRNQKHFTEAQMEETKKIAKVRIHVERAIQRLKVYKILSHRIPINLLSSIEKIFHICAALVNLQAPILKSRRSNQEEEEDDDDATIIDENEYGDCLDEADSDISADDNDDNSSDDNSSDESNFDDF